MDNVWGNYLTFGFDGSRLVQMHEYHTSISPRLWWWSVAEEMQMDCSYGGIAGRRSYFIPEIPFVG